MLPAFFAYIFSKKHGGIVVQEENNSCIKHEPFKSTDNSSRYARRHYTKRYEKNEWGSFSSAAVKIGLCIAICIALCIINLSVGTEEGWFTANKEDDDAPGKLRFVELPGIIEVFAGGDELTMPVGEYKSAILDENTNLLQLTTTSNATVVTCGSGTVKAIGKDETYGNFVVIRHNDLETYYYGFGYITVEEKQVINKLDTLGLLTQSGVMYLQVQENGKAVDPCDYLPVNG